MYCNRLEVAGNRGLGPASVIVIVARSTENASVDSCHVALMTILILESIDSNSSRRLACVSYVHIEIYSGFARFALLLHASCIYCFSELYNRPMQIRRTLRKFHFWP